MVYAVQGEKNSRKIRFDLFNGGVQWKIDQSASVLIAYKKPDGHGGMYDVLDNGESAFAFATDSTNSVIITLSEQVLTTPGNVPLVVSFVLDNKILSTFGIALDVLENPGIDAAESTDYFSLSVAIDAATRATEEIIQSQIFASTEYVDENIERLRVSVGEELEAIEGDLKVFYVTISENDNGELQSNQPFDAVVGAYEAGRKVNALVSIDGEQVSVPLIGIVEGNTALYSGNGPYDNFITISQTAISINISFKNHLSDDDVDRAIEQYMLDNPSVKSVNGIVPDEKGNVEITALGGTDSGIFYDVRTVGKKLVNGDFSRIVLLGDSITDGYGGTDYNGSRDNAKSTNTEGYCWANVFKKYIAERYGIPVENYGYHGSVAKDQYNRVIDALNPTDLVIWLSGTNNRISSDLFLGYESNIADYVQEIKSKVAALVFMPCIPATLPGEDRYKTTQDINDVALRKVYGSTYYIDLYSKFIEYCNQKGLSISDTMYDTLHPNDTGYLLMFHIICNELGLPLYFYTDFSYSGDWWGAWLVLDTGTEYASYGRGFDSWDEPTIPVMQLAQYNSGEKTTLFSGQKFSKIIFEGNGFTPGTLTIGTVDINTLGVSCTMENATTVNVGQDGIARFENGFSIPANHTLAIGAKSDTARLSYITRNAGDNVVGDHNRMCTMNAWVQGLTQTDIALVAKFYRII